MTNIVHYMVRSPFRLGELIYPIELGDSNYQAHGSFFIDGFHIDDLRDSYTFYALYDDVVQPVRLERVANAHFEAAVPKIGAFRFAATKIGMPAKYGGRLAFPAGIPRIRQLAPKSRPALERAARDFNFYFIGFSPVIDEAGGLKSLAIG